MLASCAGMRGYGVAHDAARVSSKNRRRLRQKRKLRRAQRARARQAVLPIVAAALLLMGSSTHRKCPEGMVPIGSTVCIDRFEWPNQAGVKPALAMSAIAEPEDRAAGIVMDAEQLCASVGKRVCYDDEWIQACEGPGGTRYPFGDKLPKFTPGEGTGLCNYDKWFRNVDERKVFLRDPAELRRLDQSEPAGARDTCISASGAMDMVGSAEEWVRTREGGYALAGRFWAEVWPCRSMSHVHAPNWHYYQSGFRCCLDLGERP